MLLQQRLVLTKTKIRIRFLVLFSELVQCTALDALASPRASPLPEKLAGVSLLHVGLRVPGQQALPGKSEGGAMGLPPLSALETKCVPLQLRLDSPSSV